MTVNDYLRGVAAACALDAKEIASINTSIGAIQQRLDMFFEGEVSNHFRFGSSVRGTILPRRLDDHSDIDYMIVFAERDAQPQTYLDRLRRFADAYYSSSDRKQSHPSIVLELNHIKFDLVPATTGWMNSYQIPTLDGGWQTTDPADFSRRLEEADRNHKHLLKPTIRIAKVWNASRGYVFDSFAFEKWIADKNFIFCSSLRDYVFHVFEQLNALSESTQWRREEIQRVKDGLTSILNAEINGQLDRAIRIAATLFPY